MVHAISNLIETVLAFIIVIAIALVLSKVLPVMGVALQERMNAAVNVK